MFIMIPRNGVFLGIDLFVNEDGSSCRAVVSVNDGCFCIDSITLNFRIECRTDANHMHNNIQVYARTCLDNIGCFNLDMDGVFTIPKPLHCSHKWIRIKPPIYSNGIEEIIRGVKKIWEEKDLKLEDQRIFMCSKCDRVRLLVDYESELKKSNEFIPYHILREIFGHTNLSFEMMTCILLDMNQSVTKFIKCYIEKNNMKVIAVGFCISSWLYPEYFRMNNRIFWSMLDAFPCYFFSSLKDPDSRADSFARKSTELIGYNGIIQLEMEKHNKINVNLLGSSLVSIEDYKSFYGPFYSSIFDEIALLARDLKTKRISFISSTSRGGDITLMRQAQMRFYQLIGANVSWYVTIPVNTVSKIVKYKLRDVMESAVPEDTILQAQEIIDLENWTSMNVSRLWHNSVFKNTHIVIFDDLQTSGFVRYLREINPEAKIIFRSHIHMNAELYPRNKAVTDVYNYITHNLEGIDLFVAQPMNTPIPQLGMHPIAYLSSSTDPLDGLNKTLSDTDRAYYTRIFRESCHEHTRKYFRFQSPYIIQTSSFDRSKGQKECIDVFRIIYDMISMRINDESDALYGLYLVIVGHGNIDDPEGTEVFNELVEYLNEQHNCAIRDRVLIVKIPPIEQILNVLIENACVALQLSQCDGFETRVTNCILKNVPAVVNNVGGLRLQVLENKTGYIVDRGDLHGVAHKVLYLLDNDSFRNGMIEYREYSFMFTTPFNVYGWLHICKVLVEGGVITEEDVFKQIIKKYFHKYAHEFLLKME